MPGSAAGAAGSRAGLAQHPSYPRYLHPPALGGSKPLAAAEDVTHGSASLPAIDVSDGQISRSVFYTDELAAA